MLQYPHLSGLELQEAQGRVYERLNKLLMDPFASFNKADCKAWFRQIKVYMLSFWALHVIKQMSWKASKWNIQCFS